MIDKQAVWYHKHWGEGDDIFYRPTETVPDGAVPLYSRPQLLTDGLHLVIAGAIFDFAGFLTTRDKVIEVGSTAEAAPIADLVEEWASARGLSLEDAAVLSWQEWLKNESEY